MFRHGRPSAFVRFAPKPTARRSFPTLDGRNSMAHEFCAECVSRSDDVSAGDVLSLNFIGRSFLGSKNRCPRCGSTERNLFFFLLLPIVPLGSWKVMDVGSGRIITRKLLKGSIADLDTHATYTPEQQKRWNKKLIIGFLVFVVAANVLIRLFK